jgi:hypothetical protein
VIVTGKASIGDTPNGNSPGPSMFIGEEVSGIEAAAIARKVGRTSGSGSGSVAGNGCLRYLKKNSYLTRGATRGWCWNQRYMGGIRGQDRTSLYSFRSLSLPHSPSLPLITVGNLRYQFFI